MAELLPIVPKEDMLAFMEAILEACEADNAHLPTAPEEIRHGYVMFRAIRNFLLAH